MTSLEDKKYLSLCLELAKKGEGKTSPNPMVGCVIVKNGKIIGKGYHKSFGKPHAEIEAINSVKNKSLLRGATLYVNLEPCCHWGKTPPCVDSIIKYGIKNVVCCTLDPNPIVNGKGIKKLRNNNIFCKTGILANDAKKLNKHYFKWIKTGLPYVTIKSAVTLDGKISTFDGNSKWISSEKSRKYVYSLRTKYDAILVGLNTVLIDNPSLTSHGFGKNPIRIVVGNINKIPVSKIPEYKIFNDGNETIFVTPKKLKYKVLLEKFKNVKIVEITGDIKNNSRYNINPKEIFSNIIFSSITSVLVEGGGETVWNFINSGLADDFVLFISPKIFGGRDAKTFVEGSGVATPNEAFKVKFDKVQVFGEDILVEGHFLKNN
jgi:diaminohydroxyphosphoribosylaminopyrimidine deaminase/5-amino-6-(5-phosphoribosylamino)uracil reductase